MSIVPASRMRKLGYRPSLVNSIIKNQIALINNKLQKFDKTWGRNVLVHVIPTHFNIPGLTQERAQKLIYSQIISRLTSAGYEVKLRFNEKKKKTVIAVIWESAMTEEEVKMMDEIISNAQLGGVNTPGAVARQ